jgi:hypothetical protein
MEQMRHFWTVQQQATTAAAALVATNAANAAIGPARAAQPPQAQPPKAPRPTLTSTSAEAWFTHRSAIIHAVRINQWGAERQKQEICALLTGESLDSIGDLNPDNHQ